MCPSDRRKPFEPFLVQDTDSSSDGESIADPDPNLSDQGLIPTDHVNSAAQRQREEERRTQLSISLGCRATSWSLEQIQLTARLQTLEERESRMTREVQEAEEEIQQIREEFFEMQRQLDDQRGVRRDPPRRERIRARRQTFITKLRARK